MVAFSEDFLKKEIRNSINSDLIWMIIIFVFCILYMWFHSGSLFLAIANLLNVMCSIFVAYVVYSKVFRVKYFSTIHLAVMIIIIGVGSDDIFVFHDFWRKAFEYKALQKLPISRLSLAFR